MKYPPISMLRTEEAADLYNQLMENARIIRDPPGTPVIITRMHIAHYQGEAARIAWELDLELTAGGNGTPRPRRPS